MPKLNWDNRHNRDMYVGRKRRRQTSHRVSLSSTNLCSVPPSRPTLALTSTAVRTAAPFSADTRLNAYFIYLIRSFSLSLHIMLVNAIVLCFIPTVRGYIAKCLLAVSIGTQQMVDITYHLV